jgi:hypothetical protein
MRLIEDMRRAEGTPNLSAAAALVSAAYCGGASEDEVAARWEAHAETLAKRRHVAG